MQEQVKQDEKKYTVTIPLGERFIRPDTKEVVKVSSDNSVPKQDRGKDYTYARFLLGAADTAPATTLGAFLNELDKIYTICSAFEYDKDYEGEDITLPYDVVKSLALIYRESAAVPNFMVVQFLQYIENNKEEVK